MSGYDVPASGVRVELRFKNSRFIGIANRVDTVNAAQAFVSQTRERLPDGSHHVYAFVIGYGSTVMHGMSDDGEPSGTAGKPILAVLAGSGIGDVVLVVVRYFGGTKLGTGGLVRAYTATAQQAIEVLPIEPKVHRVAVELSVQYTDLELCKNALRETALIMGAAYGADVKLSVHVEAGRVEEIRQRLLDISAGKIIMNITDEEES